MNASGSWARACCAPSRRSPRVSCRHTGNAGEAKPVSRANGAAMRENRVKRALAAGERCLGTMIFEFPTTGIGRIAAAAGAEFLIYDMEHTGWSIETIRGLMAS